jgi:thiamine-phosphate diphosphorylase
MPAARVREVVPRGFVIGRSVHSAAEALAAEQGGGLDYLLFGTVFATPSKPQVTPAGVDALATVCRAVVLPVLAIGGMTISSLSAVAWAGAAGFAAVDLFASTGIDAMPRVIERACSAFDGIGASER